MAYDDNTPPSAMDPGAATLAWQRSEKPKLDRDRFAILALVNGLLAIALVGALIMMLPLKTVVPYIIETDAVGKTVAVGQAREGFDPTKAQVVHFIARWTEALWSIDRALTEKGLAFAFDMTRGKGSEVFRQHVAAYKPIERSVSDPTLTAAVQIKSVSFVGERTAMVRFELTERRKEIKPAVRTYMMTLHWAIVPPKTEAEIIANPIGFFITDFSWTQEVTTNE